MTQDSLKGRRAALFPALASSKGGDKGGRSERSLEEALAVLGQGFLKGGLGSSLLKGSAVSQELRVGLSHAYVHMVGAARCLL